MTGLERNSDIVLGSSYSPLLNVWGFNRAQLFYMLMFPSQRVGDTQLVRISFIYNFFLNA